jgi:hypothetical protein
MNKVMATPTVQIDNNHLRVTEWRFAPGAATGFHRHEHDYLVVPVRDGELKLIGSKGTWENPIFATPEWNTTSSISVRARWCSLKSRSRIPR